MKRNQIVTALLLVSTAIGLGSAQKAWQEQGKHPEQAEQSSTVQPAASTALAQGTGASQRRELRPLPLKRPLIIDGFGDDWPTANGVNGDPAWQEAGDGVRYVSASDGEQLYLLLDVQVGQTQFYQPDHPERPYEQIYLYWQQGEALTTRLIRSIAPGSVQGYRSGDGQLEEDPAIQGVWEVTSTGYRLELRLPQLVDGSPLGLEVNRNGQSLGNLGWLDDQLPQLRYPATALTALSLPTTRPN